VSPKLSWLGLLVASDAAIPGQAPARMRATLIVVQNGTQGGDAKHLFNYAIVERLRVIVARANSGVT
jgi:hypothetical protein